MRGFTSNSEDSFAEGCVAVLSVIFVKAIWLKRLNSSEKGSAIVWVTVCTRNLKYSSLSSMTNENSSPSATSWLSEVVKRKLRVSASCQKDLLIILIGMVLTLASVLALLTYSIVVR